MSSSESSDLKRWQDKYFALRERTESELGEYEAYRSVLQRIILRLCLSAEGQYQGFDKQLEVLRNAVRNAETSAQDYDAQLEGLNRSLEKVDAVKGESRKRYAALLRELIDDLEGLKPPRAERSELKKLARQITKKPPESDQQVETLAQYQKLHHGVMQWVSENLPERPSLMSRLLGKTGGESPPVESVTISDMSEFEEEVLPEQLEIEQQTSSDEDEIAPGFAAISEHVKATLNHLISQLSFPDSSQRALQALKERIQGPLNWYELGPTLDDLASVILSALGKGQQDIGSFLSGLDERLQAIQSQALAVIQAEQKMQQAGETLDQGVRLTLSGIHQSLSSDNDLEGLKVSIRGQLDNISDILDGFRQTAKELEAEREKELIQMRQGFELLKEQNLKFQEQLEFERSRAQTDALTGLPNRQAYDQRILLEVERWQRYRNPATLIVADVDHFKSINDTYGHLSGDKVLQILGKELQSRLRKTDFIGRYGGEEFVMIFPETQIEIASSVIDKTRETISRLPFHFRDNRVQVTMSFGLVAFREGLDAESLFDLADKALYRAKQNGRNRLEIADEP